MSAPLGILDRERAKAAGRGRPAPSAPPFEPGDAYEGDLPVPKFRFLSSADLAGGDYRPTWLVPRVLVKGQPGVIAGPSKGMKTSVLIDLAVSLAAGVPFLGYFDVPTPYRVVVVSGESGAHTIQETTRRVCRTRGVDLAAVERLGWCFDLPTLSSVADMGEFVEGLAGLRADVVFLDPLYLCLGGDIDHANMFAMGERLRFAAELLLKAGVTPILVHHANRLLKTGEPMELSHLAYSGLEQFARQFLLVNRREPYRSDGVHDLWLRAGGSAGHGGLWGVHIQEGTTDDEFGGREWTVSVQTAGELEADRATSREEGKREANRRRMQADGTAVLDAVDAETEAGREAATVTRIREATGFNASKAADAIRGLVEAGFLEVCEFQAPSGRGARQRVRGYRRTSRGSVGQSVGSVGQPD